MTARAHPRTDAGKVFVRDNNIDGALRVLKKKKQRDGKLPPNFFVSKGQQARIDKKKAVQRQFKKAVRRTMSVERVDKQTAIALVKKTRSPR